MTEMQADPSKRGCGNINCQSCQALLGPGPWCGYCGKDMSHRFDRTDEYVWTEVCDDESCEAFDSISSSQEPTA